MTLTRHDRYFTVTFNHSTLAVLQTWRGMISSDQLSPEHRGILSGLFVAHVQELMPEYKAAHNQQALRWIIAAIDLAMETRFIATTPIYSHMRAVAEGKPIELARYDPDIDLRLLMAGMRAFIEFASGEKIQSP